MNCDACSKRIKFQHIYVYGDGFDITMCLECAAKIIPTEEQKTKKWMISVLTEQNG